MPAIQQPRRMSLTKIAYALAGLFVFVLALQLMKAGAKSLAPILRETALLKDPIDSLGFGWLGAYLVLSGSPVAAAALSLFNGGALTALQTFTMINGSRMGASFIVLFIGFIYILRGQEPKRSLGMGLLSLLTTWTLYIPALFLGGFFLTHGPFDPVPRCAARGLVSFVDTVL